MSDDKPTHTADELRSRAKVVEFSNYETASMLRAGADAMDQVAAVEAEVRIQTDAKVEAHQQCGEQALKTKTAEARVAVLEKALFVANGKANAAKRLIDKAEALGGTNFGKITTADILEYRRECEVLEARAALGEKP
jgi:hypothetical protein